MRAKAAKFSILIIMSLLLASVVFTGAASAIWDGESVDTSWYDKKADTYTITTEAQLAGLAKLVNDGTSTFKGKTIYLADDLDLDGKSWTPIGVNGYMDMGTIRYFEGIFDGKGHTIHNLFIDIALTTRHLGLFGYILNYNAEIRNLNLKGVLIQGNMKDFVPGMIGSLVGEFKGNKIVNCTVYNLEAITYTLASSYLDNTPGYVGGLVGYLNHGVVEDCHVYRSPIYDGGLYGSKYIGGLIGLVDTEFAVKNCSSDCDVHGNSGVGGLIGFIMTSSSSKEGIINCQASGNVDGVKPDSTEKNAFAYDYVGGLIGSVEPNIPIANCVATGRVLGIEYVGGLTGNTKGTISNSCASGYVAGKEYVGGLAGYAARSISNSQASGNVVGTTFVGGLVGDGDSSHDMILTNCQATGNVKGTTYVGGLAGRTNDHIRSCKASGTVTATGEFAGGLVGYADRTGNAKTIQDCSAEGDVTGQKNVGGLLGYSCVNVVSCHANGTVSGKPDTTAGSYIGGFIGQSKGKHSITIKNCYATGDVTDGSDYVGGLVGYADDHVSTCYAAGDVSASGKYVGGLVGYADKTIKMSYATGTVSGNTDVGGLAGHVDDEITTCYATGSVSGTTNVGGVSGTSDADIVFSVALNKEVTGTSNVGTFSGKFKGSHHTVGSCSWSGMSGGGGDKGTPFDSNRIWDCFPKKMWAGIIGFGQLGADTWQENTGNEYFKMPVLKSIGFDTVSEALHLDPVSVHTVTFETEHGQPVPSQEVPTGGKVTRPTPDPLESKFWFTGWYTDSSCTSLWDFDTDTVLTNMTLYAGWKMVPLWEVYQVVFDVQGHGTTPSSQYVGMGQSASEPTPAPTEEGWTFTGWYTTSACTTNWNFNSTVNKDMFLYAGWKQNTCLVRFDVQGNGTAPDSQFIVPGGKVSEPNAPEDEKNAFMGWYKESACTNVWDFDTDTVTGDIMLYAKWSPKMKVTFDVQGHGTVPDVQYVVSGENATNPGDLEEEDYRFTGWYNESTCVNTWDFSTQITTDITIYAGWIKTYHVYFNNRGRGNETETQTVDMGQPAVQPGDPVDANYVFAGWYTDSDYTTLWDFSTPITGPTQIVAKWTPKTYTVTFDTQGGTTQTWTEDLPYGELIAKPNDPVKSGYSFDGWYTDTTGGDRWNFATDVVSGVTTLYANWTQSSHSITVTSHPNSTVDLSKYSAASGENIIVTVYPDHGYNCTAVTSSQVSSIPTPVQNNDCWTTNFTMPDTDVSLTVTVTIMPLQTVTITTPVNGTIIAEASNGTVSNVSISGYEGDWITLYVLPETKYAVKNSSVNVTYNSNTTAVGVSTYDGYLTGSFVMPAYPVTVDATFIQTVFTITATAGDHGKIFTDPQTGSAGESVNITLVPDTGYNLSSFSVNGVDKKSAIVWSGNEGVYTCQLENDITVRAEFVKIATPYTITNTSAGYGRVVTNMLSAYAGETVQVDLIGEPGYVAESATYTDTDGQTQTLTIYPIDGKYSSEFIMPANSTTVSGTFKLMNITVTFNLDGTGTVNPTNKTVYYGQQYGTLPTPSRDFNFFRGWYNTSGEQVTETSIVTTAGDHSLIANWSGPIATLNTHIDFGTEYTGYSERTINDRVLNQFDDAVKLRFPVSSWFNFTNASTQEVLNGCEKALVKNVIYAFNTTVNPGLSEGYYTADIGVIGVVNSQDVDLGNITVTMSVLPATMSGNAYTAVPDLPVFNTFAGGPDPTGGKLRVIFFTSPENLVQISTGQDNITNATIIGTSTAQKDRTSIQVLNAFNITTPSSNLYGFIPLPDSGISAVYPATNLENGGTYSAVLGMKEVSGNLPTLIGTFNKTIASTIQTEEGVTAIAMVSAVNDDNALAVMNELILDDGVSVSFKVAKSKVSDTNKLLGYHVDAGGINRTSCEITGSNGDYYTIQLTGTGFSTYVLAQSSTPVTPSSGGSSSSHHSGSSQMAPSPTVDITAEPTLAPTPVPTTDAPSASASSSTTQTSPVPVAGLIVGLGAASLVLARMRK